MANFLSNISAKKINMAPTVLVMESKIEKRPVHQYMGLYVPVKVVLVKAVRDFDELYFKTIECFLCLRK